LIVFMYTLTPTRSLLRNFISEDKNIPNPSTQDWWAGPDSNRRPSPREGIDWGSFRDWVHSKYSDTYANNIYLYASKYSSLFNNPSGIEQFSPDKKNHILKGLIALSKYLGVYNEFQKRLEDYGVKWSRKGSVDSFLRIMNSKSSDVLEWVQKATRVLDDKTLSTFLRFCTLSGLRKAEAIHSFNLILKLHKSGDLGEYYNRESQTLEHFNYPKLFLRNSKNVFISMIPEALVREIAETEPVTYQMLRGRLYRRDMRMRLNELRDYWGTFMVNHGLIREEVDLLQGRISKSIFVRNYWSPAIRELRDRVFKALEQLKRELA
jgi:intergrase/recombinase